MSMNNINEKGKIIGVTSSISGHIASFFINPQNSEDKNPISFCNVLRDEIIKFNMTGQ